MKFVKRAKLAFTEGNSDKVYEVDLCELLNDSERRFLVNFRYGRRGAKLKEGTKTPQPLDYRQAEDIFNSLVVSKTNKGYVDVSSANSKPPQSSYSGPLDLDGFLNRIDDEKDSGQRARLIWRLPQTANPELASRLAQRLNNSDFAETYSRLWTIGRTGDSRQAEAVLPFFHSNDGVLSNLACEILFKFKHPEAEQIRRSMLSELPRELADSIQNADEAAIAARLPACLTDNKNVDNNSLLRTLYLLAADLPILHRALFEFVKTVPFEPGWFKGLRYIFKMAEFRFDAEMFALLGYRFEKTKAYFSSEWNWAYVKGVGSMKISDEIVKPNSRLAYSNKTRNYLRRRSWRTLKRLGLRNDDRYADMAARLLLQFSESDKAQDRTGQSYSWQTDSYTTKHYDGYANYIALNAILRTGSARFERSPNRMHWIRLSEEPETGRTEAFPHIWDRRPQLLLELLINGRAEIVGQFAARALKDNDEFCRQINDEQIYGLLISPMQSAIEFAAGLLRQREISRALLILLFKSGNETACSIAFNALKQINDVFAEPELLTALLLIDYPPLNDWLAEQWRKHSFSYPDNSLLQTLTDALAEPNASLSPERAAGLADLFIDRLEEVVSSFAVDKIDALLAHEDVGIQLFAARLLAANSISFRSIPQATLERINNSQHSAIRAIGIALLSKTSDYDLLNQLPLLVELIYRGEAEERRACFELLTGLLPGYDRQIFGQLLPLVFKEERQPEQQQQLFDFINQNLTDARNALDKDTVWRLIHASSVAAQRLGIGILCLRNPTDFTIKQWVALANNPNQSVRDYVQRAFADNVDLVKQNTSNALRILESKWQDSREFGFDFFKRCYQEQDWSPELIVSVCDSNLPDTQAFGRELLQTFFKREQGEEYLSKLSQHPSVQVQAFVANLLNDYASGKPEVILSLSRYFTGVLSQVNKGRVSKDSVLAFLIKEAQASPQVLEMVAALFTRLSLTLVHKDKSQLIKAMLTLRKQHPELDLPIAAKPVRVLSAVQGENYAG